MIVLDESIYRKHLAQDIGAWYKGRVISLNELRPQTLIKDESVSTLLLRVSQPTFLTINVRDFWIVAQPHADYCVIAVPLQQDQANDINGWLRRCLRLPQFRTKAGRMGKIILLKPTGLEYYALDRRVLHLGWSE